jgi:hypothetical protein
MNNDISFRRIAGVSAIVSGPLALASFLVLSLAVEFDFTLLSNTAALVALGAGAAEVFRWGEVLGTFGYSLLLAPAAIYLWNWLKPRSHSLISLYCASGLAYLLLGAVGGALRASVLPEMMVAYAEAPVAAQAAIAANFQTMTVVIFTGLGALEAILGGVWLLGNGLAMRSERRLLGIAAAILGIATLGYGAGELLRVEALVNLGAITYLLFPFWVMWLGLVILRGAEQGRPADQPAPAT